MKMLRHFSSTLPSLLTEFLTTAVVLHIRLIYHRIESSLSSSQFLFQFHLTIKYLFSRNGYIDLYSTNPLSSKRSILTSLLSSLRGYF